MLLYNISDSTLWIVGAFLLITLVVGLYAGRGIKDIKEYALGGKRFSTATLVLTFLATDIGGGTVLGFTGDVYSFGIIVTVASLALVLRSLFIAFFIAPNITKFKNCITIGDIMDNLYGSYAKVFTGIVTLIFSICIICMQFMTLGVVFESILGIKPIYGIFVGGIILSIYSSLGGIKAVTYTDVFQFLILIVVIPFIATICLKKIGGYKAIFYVIPSEKLSILNHKKLYYYLGYFLMVGIFPGALTSPAIIQRLLMSKNPKQIRNQFLTISFFTPFFNLTLMVIGLSSFILFKNINPKQIFPQIISSLLLSNLLKGLVISGILAVIMSTADSYLHSLGLLFSRDIIKPIFKKRRFSELTIAKRSTIVFALACIYATSHYSNVMELVFGAVKGSGPTILFPLIIGILGLKTDKKSLVSGIIIGSITFLFADYQFSNSLKILALPISIIANGIAYMTYHILQNKGIAWIKRNENKKEETKLWIPNPQQIINTIINFIPTPKKIYEYSRYQIMKNGSENMIFGIYCCINFTFPYFLWDHQDPEKFNLMTNLRFIGGIMAGLLIVKDQWKEFLKPYFPLYWHITLTYCLPFITTVMFLLTEGSLSWLMNVGTSIFFLIMLITGEVFLILAPLGIGLGIIFYSYFVGPISMSALGFDINYFLFYQVFFSTVIGLLFAYRKRVFNIRQGNISLNLGESLCHELRNTLYSLSCNQYNRMRMNPIIEQGTKNIEGEEGYFLKKELFESLLHQTNEAINFDNDSLKVISAFENLFRDYKKSLSKPGVHSMKSTVEYTLEELHFLSGQKERIEINLTDDFYAKIPKELFAFVLSNLIRNSFKHGGRKELKVKIKLENHKLIISDNGKGISSSNLEKVFKMHYTTGQKGESTGIGLGFCKIIVNSFYGDIWCESEEGENSYTEFHIKFPEVNPSEITKHSLSEIKEEGKNEGERNQKENFAIKMLKAKKSIKEIEKYTDLTRSEIEELKKKL